VEQHSAGCNVRIPVATCALAKGAMSLECGNAACRKALMPPFLQCAKCKAAAYCSKACQVPPPQTHMQRAAPEPAPVHTDPLLRACPPRSLPLDGGVEERAQARVCTGAGRGGRADPAGRAGSRAPCAERPGGADQGAEAPVDTAGRAASGARLAGYRGAGD
jgi:hypothetical protein